MDTPNPQATSPYIEPVMKYTIPNAGNASAYKLALQLIGSYLSAHQEESGDYLRWLQREELTLINNSEDQAQSILVLLQRTYDSLTPNEQHVFLLLGLLTPAPFPSEL